MSATVAQQSLLLDAVISSGAPTSYVAVYMRLATQAELPEAVRAIESLCPADRTVPG
jgi:hypothetical protein